MDSKYNIIYQQKTLDLFLHHKTEGVSRTMGSNMGTIRGRTAEVERKISQKTTHNLDLQTTNTLYLFLKGETDHFSRAMVSKK